MSNEILKSALIEAFNRDFSDIPSNEEIAKTHEFSEKYRLKMKKLQKISRRKYIYIFNKPIRRMAVIAACILIIFTASMSIEAVRTPVIKFCMNIYEKFSAVFFVSDDGGELSVPTELEILYFPAYMPDGYSLADEINISNTRILIFSNKDNDEISFQQNILTIEITIDTEGIITEDIFIHNIKGIFYSNKRINNILWHDNQYGYLIRGSIDKTILQSIAESLKVEK